MIDSSLAAGFLTTYATKTLNGWEVRSTLPIPQSRRLSVLTRKQGDFLDTTASVATSLGDGSYQTVTGIDGEGDFQANLAREKVSRVTKAKAQAFHEQQLSRHLQPVLIGVRDHYRPSGLVAQGDKP
jgi:hypothetical protein